tara:strand:+ start:941 stop:1369 length:429 start_codon:yes stop_codon:yes gene_type:complete
MRYFLFVLLFIFSTKSFSGEIDGKGLDCIIKNSQQTYSQMFWFNNGRWAVVFYWEATDKVYPKETLGKHHSKYFTTHNTLTFNRLEIDNKLDRKTLKLKRYHKVYELDEVGACKVFVGFDTVKKKQAELIKAIEKSKRENKI